MSATVRPFAGQQKAFEFKRLPRYSRDEVVVWNWSHRFLREADWRAWIQDAWSELLNVPAGFEILLSYRDSADVQQEPAKHAFKQREIFIGREPDNDVKLPTLTVGKRHARIFVENGQCFLEDLESSLGTYLNQNKLAPKQPYPVGAGDQIAIFPYTFTVSLRQLWMPELNIGIHSPVSESMTWREFLDFSPRGRTTFPIEVHPIRGGLCLEVNRAFLTDLVERLLRPLDLHGLPSVLGPTDSGFLEFIIVCLLERVNRDLAFPFQFDTGGCGSKPTLAPDTRGIVLTCSLSLLATTGALRLFAPYDLLERMQKAVPNKTLSWRPSFAAWKFAVSLGFQPLTTSEMSQVELGDVLLFQPQLELRMPGQRECGWRISQIKEETSPGLLAAFSNIQRIQIDNYFEREPLISGDLQSGEAPKNESFPDLGQLPLHVHVIVAEKELTLAEANVLAAGTILELDHQNNGQVSLAINGKILGEGQLVEIDGRLGVRISSWKGA
jgi:type III secretion system YscQ/HrcQ family protein